MSNINTVESLEKSVTLLEEFSKSINSTISNTSISVQTLIEKESEIKQLLTSDNLSWDEVNKLKWICNELLMLILNIKTNSVDYIKELENEKKQVQWINDNLLRENKELLKDELTGLWNRHAFNKYLAKLLKKYINDNKIYSMCVIDLDKFKSINDNYWHDFWDLVLKFFANSLYKNLNYTYKIFRFWWEEFIVLGECKKEQMLEDIDVIRDEISRKKIKSKSHENVEIKVSFSAWISEVSPNDNFSEENWFNQIFKRADTLLYKAKEDWRNNIKI